MRGVGAIICYVGGLIGGTHIHTSWGVALGLLIYFVGLMLVVFVDG